MAEFAFDTRNLLMAAKLEAATRLLDAYLANKRDLIISPDEVDKLFRQAFKTVESVLEQSR